MPRRALNNICFVPLTQGKYALIDESDFPRVMRHKWHARKDGNGYYAARKARNNGAAYTLYLHRHLLDAKPGQQIDHVNGDGLDCRRSNLRFCDHSQNQANRRPQKGSSQYRGVCKHDNGRWYAGIKVAGRVRSLGGFDDERAAASAYNVAAQKCFGEFARLNCSDASFPSGAARHFRKVAGAPRFLLSIMRVAVSATPHPRGGSACPNQARPTRPVLIE